MTPRQREALDFIARYIADRGYSPSYQEVADAIGLASKSGVCRIVRSLVQRGHLKQEHALGGWRNLLPDSRQLLASVPTANLIEELNRRGVKDMNDA